MLSTVSQMVTLDVWMLASMTFIFCTLLELAIIGYMVRDEGKPKKKSSRPSTPCPVKAFYANLNII